MSVQIGRWAVGIAAAIGAGAAWFLEWSPAASAAVGAVLVPIVAIAGGTVFSSRPTSLDAEQPPRGPCECGHLMSMHCGVDASGPCAVDDCRCAGRDRVTSTDH